MNRRQLLSRSIGALALLGALCMIGVLASALRPSGRARSDAELVFPVPELVPGQLVIVHVGARPLFILRPTEEQRASVATLDAYVGNVTSDAFVPALGAYVYWGLSTKFDCELREQRPQDSRLLGMDRSARWLGGYWDPTCEVSYDYSGRAIKEWRFTFNGYTGSYPGLSKPCLRITDGNIILSLL